MAMAVSGFAAAAIRNPFSSGADRRHSSKLRSIGAEGIESEKVARAQWRLKTIRART